MDYWKITKRDIETQKKLLKSYYRELETLPEGKLHCKMINGTLRYYRWDKKHKVQKYIRKKDAQLINDLKHRRVLEEAVKAMETNLKLQEKILEKYRAYDPHSCQDRLGTVYQDLPEKLYGQEKNKDAFFVYRGPKSNYRSDERIHKSTMGISFRSKSEALIAELLYKSGIPFIYEETLTLYDEYGERHRYKPDFKIVLPDGRVIYWEHFGRMDLAEYREKNFKRLTIYHYNNIMPPNNLIITMDDKRGGLDISAIMHIIETQLLPFFQ